MQQVRIPGMCSARQLCRAWCAPVPPPHTHMCKRIATTSTRVHNTHTHTRRHTARPPILSGVLASVQGLRYSVWPAEGPMFPKLRLKYKPNLISLAGGLADLPITDPSARATPVPPKQWKEMAALAEANKVVMLDVRNDYEWDAGHFRGAARPAEEEFNDTPVRSGWDEG